MKNRYLVSTVADEKRIDERLFTFYRTALIFAVGQASVINSLHLMDGQIYIKDRKKKLILDVYVVNIDGAIEYISNNFLKYLKPKKEKR